jgi:hypothetical protein
MSIQHARATQRRELPSAERELYEGPAASLQRRRAAAVRIRRRRLLAADVGIGAALALFGGLAAPGLAVLALAALLTLAACGAWLIAERLLARRARAARPRRRRRRRPFRGGEA